ncbi:MAG TPA: two-component system response regulator CreB [Ideonella sp.]|nr:two-component system response regulator CreB [Ideonella sp.]
MATRLLLLEDDPAIAHTVGYALAREGYEVVPVSLVREAAAALAGPAHGFAAALLDVGLPDGSGLDLCRELRRANPQLPIALLTARGEEMDRVLGLELGADDYLTKPFSPRELVARVRALLRRAALTPAAPPPAPRPALFESDPAGTRIRFGEQWLRLTRREHGLLSVLLRQPGRIWSREALLDAVWGPDADSTDRTVDTHIKTLRAKLREARPELDPIATHRGLGYAIELKTTPR